MHATKRAMMRLWNSILTLGNSGFGFETIYLQRKTTRILIESQEGILPESSSYIFKTFHHMSARSCLSRQR